MSNFVTVNGMILSSMPVDEFDRRLVILTKERGKISVFAQGARRMNNPLCGVTRVFSMGTFELYESRTSYKMKSASISNFFDELTRDYEAVYYGYYFAELTEYFTRENLDGAGFLNLLYCAFRALEAKKMNKNLIRYTFELKCLVLNGEYPQVFKCTECGSEELLTAFCASAQGVVCSKCNGKAGDAIAIDQSTLYTLQYIITSRLEKLFSFCVSERVQTELKMIMGRLMNIAVDKKMKSLEVIDEVFLVINKKV